MLGRFGTALALALVAALVLVACTPEEPRPEEDSRLLVEATFEGFYRSVDDQFASGVASADQLAAFATERLAQEWARDIQAVLASGASSRGVLVAQRVEVTSESEEAVEALICTDGRGIETINADGSTQQPSQFVAWEANFVRTRGEQPLLLDSLEPSLNVSICGG